ncbi:hypothetical protein N878_06690 [Pseudomonas sp. EGD-AK9]|nr:hypothetical protein N878_06690 [Pseudomonas sp. EGD-AK9]
MVFMQALALSDRQRAWGAGAARHRHSSKQDSGKNSIKLPVPGEQQRPLCRVTCLTGSKNALEGVGFFLGGHAQCPSWVFQTLYLT